MGMLHEAVFFSLFLFIYSFIIVFCHLLLIPIVLKLKLLSSNFQEMYIFILVGFNILSLLILSKSSENGFCNG